MTDSLSDIRLAVLSRMVDQVPGQKLGRTQIMKLFYFLQELKGAHLGYDFRLFTYGPFDSEVLSDLATACNLDTVIEKTVIYARGYGYDVTPGPHANQLSQKLATNHSELCAKVDLVIQEFSAFGAAELELRSTILFVDREFSESKQLTSLENLSERVRQIKPHFTHVTILERIREMQEKAWLQSLPL